MATYPCDRAPVTGVPATGAAYDRVPVTGVPMTGPLGLRVEVRQSDLASAPSPGELEAITLAIAQALAPAPPVEATISPSDWRFSGRWWRQLPGAPGSMGWFAKALE